MKTLLCFGFALIWLLANSAHGQQLKANVLWMYIGTYTAPNKSEGIYICRLDLNTGELNTPQLAAKSPNPSFLTIDPSGKYVYACNEVNRGNGMVTAFAINSDGSLKELNQKTSGGTSACYVSTDPSGKVAMVANYGSGSVESLPIHEDGTLGDVATFDQHQGKGANPQRQEGPHGHCIDSDPAGKFVLSCDLGLDKVLIYRLDAATAKLTPNDPAFGSVPAGSGPRHIAFHPNGKLVYVINEMGSSVTAFHYDPQAGSLQPFQTTSTLPDDFKGESSGAEIQVHPNGKFLYASNRGHDSIAVFAIDDSGKLTPVDHTSTQGKMPRSFGIEPTGTLLVAANQSGNNLVVFRIDQNTGKLTPTGSNVKLDAPVCVKFMRPPH